MTILADQSCSSTANVVGPDRTTYSCLCTLAPHTLCTGDAVLITTFLTTPASPVFTVSSSKRLQAHSSWRVNSTVCVVSQTQPADLGGKVLCLQDNRAASLAIGKAGHVGHGGHISNEVGLVLAGGHQSVVHVLLVKQQPLWHLPHSCTIHLSCVVDAD